MLCFTIPVETDMVICDILTVDVAPAMWRYSKNIQFFAHKVSNSLAAQRGHAESVLVYYNLNLQIMRRRKYKTRERKRCKIMALLFS